MFIIEIQEQLCKYIWNLELGTGLMNRQTLLLVEFFFVSKKSIFTPFSSEGTFTIIFSLLPSRQNKSQDIL